MKSYWPIVFNRAGHHHKRYRLKKVHEAGAHIISTIHHHLISKALDGTDATETNRHHHRGDASGGRVPSTADRSRGAVGR